MGQMANDAGGDTWTVAIDEAALVCGVESSTIQVQDTSAPKPVVTLELTISGDGLTKEMMEVEVSDDLNAEIIYNQLLKMCMSVVLVCGFCATNYC